MTVAQSKVCRKCGQEKSAEAFPRNRRECRICMKERQRRWERANREHVNQLSRKWAAANHALSRAIKERWYEANRSEVLAARKTEYWADVPAARARGRAEYRKNPDGIKARVREWENANPLRVRTYHKNRRARLRNLPCNWTAGHAAFALTYWKSACATCRLPFGLLAVVHFDHWVPLVVPNSPGTVAGNMIPLCDNCNLTKNSREADEWLRDRFGINAEKIARSVAAFFKAIQIERKTS